MFERTTNNSAKCNCFDETQGFTCCLELATELNRLLDTRSQEGASCLCPRSSGLSRQMRFG